MGLRLIFEIEVDVEAEAEAMPEAKDGAKAEADV